MSTILALGASTPRKRNQVQTRPWHQRRQPLHNIQRSTPRIGSEI